LFTLFIFRVVKFGLLRYISREKRKTKIGKELKNIKKNILNLNYQRKSFVRFQLKPTVIYLNFLKSFSKIKIIRKPNTIEARIRKTESIEPAIF